MKPDPTSTPLILRPARQEDVPLILTYIRELAEYERLEQSVVATEEELRRHLFGQRPAAEVILAEWDGKPAGFALFFFTFSTFLERPGIYLEDLYVRPWARGHGIGRSLLVHLARLACQHHCGRLEWSVLNWNEPAIAFYRRMGAVPLEEWTVYRLSGEALERLAAGEE